MSKYPIIIAACLAVSVLVPIASAEGNGIEEMKHLLSSVNDPKMAVTDLAFFLVTHNYDARPAKDYVELKLDGNIYKLIPNGGGSRFMQDRSYW